MADKTSHHAHKLCRLLAKLAIANEIGPEACWMLDVIAHTEDARHYSGPVAYWNEQLMAVCGIASVGRLGRVRQRAVDAGWLVYTKGAKGRAALYSTTIPPQYCDIPDGPIDESSDIAAECGREMEQQAERKRKESGKNPERKRKESGKNPETFNPIPIPIPNPVPNPKKKAATADLSFDAILAKMDDEDRASSRALDCTQFRDAWALWLQYQKELKSRGKLTASSAKGQIKKLAKLGPDEAVAMIEHTVTMGWVGLRAPETRNGEGDSTEQKGFL